MDNVYPNQAVLISTRGNAQLLGKKVSKDNIMTAAWHCPLSFDPPLYGVSIGKARFTHKLIQDSKVFAVNFMPHERKEEVLYCGKASGAEADKFEKACLTKEECETIDCCKVAEAAAQLECEVIDSSETGDHTFFVGKILKNTPKTDKRRLLYKGKGEFTTTQG